MIGGGGEGERQSGTTSNAQMFTQIPPVADFSNGSSASQEIHRRKSSDNTQVTETDLHSRSSSSSPHQRSLSPSTSSSSSSSRSSSLDRAKDSKRLNTEVINVASRSPSESIEPRSSSTSPVRVIHESPDRQSDSDSPRHSSASRSRSNSTDRETPDRSPEQHEHKPHRRTIKHRSRSRSRSRSYRRSRSHSRSRSSRHRKRKHSRKSRSRSRSRSRNRKHRGLKISRKKSKHRRRSRSRERQRSHEHRRSRSRDRFGRTMRGRDSYRDRSPVMRRRSRSRDRESHRPVQRDYGRRDSRDGGSSRNKEKPLNFKEQMRQELIKASKMLNESNATNLTELIEDKNILGLVPSEPSPDQPNNLALNNAVLTNLAAATQNSTVTPQVALLQTMAAMHKKAQEMTGIAVPKYYNPAAVNPLKYAEQVQKRKLLWSRPSKEKKEGPENQWQGTHFSTDQDGKMAAKFRKLMGMKTGESEGTEKVGEERKKQQEELFSRLDKEYEFARMATHTHRGVGLGFQSQSFYPH